MKDEGRGCSVLLVEDESIVARDIEKTLMSLGYRIAGVTDTGAEAVRLARQVCPDVVLMDIQLRGAMDGVAAAEEIRRQWHLPIVFLTSFADPSTIAHAKSAGPYGYVVKPFRPTELDATLRVALHQHRLSRELFAEHDWLRSLLASISDAVIATDEQGRVRYLNPLAEELTGWTLSEAIGRPVEDVFHLLTHQRQALAQCQLRQVLTTQNPSGRRSCILVGRNGREVLIEDTATPIQDSNGELVGAVGVFVDVTERRRFEDEREKLLRELERSNTELARFSHTVSHDLQAPIRNIKAFSELLVRRTAGRLGPEEVDLVSTIATATDKMETLIRALLGYAQAGQEQVNKGTVSVGAVMDTVLTTLQPLISETNAQVTYAAMPTLEADAVQLQQLFQNLLTNALKYRRPNQSPRVEVSAVGADGGWRIGVKDNGLGIAPEHLERIFEPLRRLHGADIPGTGMGLAICRTIVERHGGRMWVDSTGVGQGATFYVFLPE